MVDAIKYPEFGPYSNVQRWSQNPSWVPATHQARIGSYAVYEQIYWSHVAVTYKVMNRGLDQADEPLYVPSSRIVVDTLNRYIGPNLKAQASPETGTPEQQLLAAQAFAALFARERFESRYAAAKRDGLIKADWGWHLMANPLKPEGSRISLVPFNPESYFPAFQDEVIDGGDPDVIAQVRLAELVQQGDETLVRVQLYDRTSDDKGTIVSSLTLWKPEEWHLWRFDDDKKSPVQVLTPPTPLPPQITAFPVYHVPHNQPIGEAFGSSVMRGLEVLQAALNQGHTDEDLALALMGLGVFATDAPGNPTTPDGAATDWLLYPGVVLQNSKGLRRVEGITSVQPYSEKFARLEGYMADATGATDAARGRIEVTEAESGIALQLRLGPTLAKAEIEDKVILDVHRQLFYDLTQMWFPTFEGLNFTDVTMLPALGDKLPVNRAAEATLVEGLVLGGILSAASARNYLIKKGFTEMFDATEGDMILAEKMATAAAEGGDTTLGDRTATETGATDA
jgi:hypothetical protein